MTAHLLCISFRKATERERGREGGREGRKVAGRGREGGREGRRVAGEGEDGGGRRIRTVTIFLL